MVAINEEGHILRYDHRYVKHTISKQEKESYQEAADINSQPVDIVSIQHEFGIFGGPEGEYLIDFMAALRKPIVTTLHTVVLQPWAPCAGRRGDLRHSDVVVAMLDIARDILDDVQGRTRGSCASSRTVFRTCPGFLLKWPRRTWVWTGARSSPPLAW